MWSPFRAATFGCQKIDIASCLLLGIRFCVAVPYNSNSLSYAKLSVVCWGLNLGICGLRVMSTVLCKCKGFQNDSSVIKHLSPAHSRGNSRWDSVARDAIEQVGRGREKPFAT